MTRTQPTVQPLSPARQMLFAKQICALPIEPAAARPAGKNAIHNLISLESEDMIKKKPAKSKVKVGKLNVNKETVQDLSDDDMQKVQGASFVFTCGDCQQSLACPTNAIFCPGGAGGGKTSGKKCRP